MTNERDGEFSGRHRLFHAMVLMGGSLALRCGGETSTTGTGSGGAPTATGGAPTATGGTSTAATGGSATGGSATGGGATGGNGAGGGAIILPATGGQGTVDPGPFDCPPAQWNCAADFPTCNGSGFRLPEKCSCDATRPLTAEACGVGQSFVCLEARYTLNGERLAQPIAFDCACTPNQLGCGLACDARFSNNGNCTQKDYADTGLREILCGCAVIVLR